MKSLNFRFFVNGHWIYSTDFEDLSEYFKFHEDYAYNLPHYIFIGKKDKNGKNIYEGDIVHGCKDNSGRTFTYYVKHDPDGDWTWNFPDGLCCSLEIIGNKIENPILLGDCFDPDREESEDD